MDDHGAGKSGEIAIVPGKPDASEVVERILSTAAAGAAPVGIAPPKKTPD